MEHCNSASQQTKVQDHVSEDYFNILTPLEIYILRHINYYASKVWGFCSKSYQTLSKEIGCSRDKIRQAVKKFKLMGMKVVHMGRSSPHIYISNSLKRLMEKLSTGEYPANTPQTTNTIYKKKKDIADAVVDNSTEEKVKEKNPCFFDGLKSLGLSMKEIFIFISFLVANRVTVGVFKSAIDRFMAYTANNSAKNKGGLFRMILRDKMDEANAPPSAEKKKEQGPFYSGVPKSYIDKWARPGELYPEAGSRLKEKYFNK